MWFFSEIKHMYGMPETTQRKLCKQAEIAIHGYWCKNKFLGFGVDDKDGEFLISNAKVTK